MFSKNVWKSIVKEHPTFTKHEVNSCVSELWKEVGDEDRRMYQQQAKENYENRIESYNSADRQYGCTAVYQLYRNDDQDIFARV